jgi:hypothetical protein
MVRRWHSLASDVQLLLYNIINIPVIYNWRILWSSMQLLVPQYGLRPSLLFAKGLGQNTCSETRACFLHVQLDTGMFPTRSMRHGHVSYTCNETRACFLHVQWDTSMFPTYLAVTESNIPVLLIPTLAEFCRSLGTNQCSCNVIMKLLHEGMTHKKAEPVAHFRRIIPESIQSCLWVLASGHNRIDPNTTYFFLPHYGYGVDLASNRNEHQESSWEGTARPARKDNKLTAICEQNVQNGGLQPGVRAPRGYAKLKKVCNVFNSLDFFIDCA